MKYLFEIILFPLFLGFSIFQIIKMYKLYTERSTKFKWFKSKKEWDKNGSNQPNPISPPKFDSERIPLFGPNSEYLRFNYSKPIQIPTVKL